MPPDKLQYRDQPAPPLESPPSAAMQKDGLDTILDKQQAATFTLGTLVRRRSFDQDFVIEAIHQHACARSLSRSSSVYSARSAQSIDSRASDKTTISQIVDMYTDLIKKIPYTNDTTCDMQILQPKAYRDTVAPLLIRRFSVECFDPATNTPPVPATSPLRMRKPKANPTLLTSHKQVPGFQEFSRNLRERRAELVSPVSVKPRDHYIQPIASSEPALSPISPPTRPFSWKGDSAVATLGVDHGAVSPIHDLSETNIPSTVPSIQVKAPEVQTKPSKQYDGMVQQQPPPIPSQTSLAIQPRDTTTRPTTAQLNKSPVSRPPPRQKSLSERYYRRVSTASDSTDSFVIYTGVGETVKALIKDKIKRRKEAKDADNIIATATHRYPGMKNRHDGQGHAVKERRKSSLSDNLDTIMRRLSATSSVKATSSAPLPPRREKQAAIPLTPYQKHGIEVWFAENKKKRKEERRRQREETQQREAQLQTHLEDAEAQQTGHRMTLVSTGAEVDDSSRQVIQEKKSGFILALEGAKNSLTHSSAQKRRERLKESIVLVGPTQLTIANAGRSGQ